MGLERDLTTGNVLKNLLTFALPIFISNLIQSVYGVVDLMVVSNFGGTSSVSGVNIGSGVMVIVINMIAGISTGGTVVVAKYLGAKRREDIKDIIGTLFIALATVGITMTVIIASLTNPILDLLNAPEEAYNEAYRYLFISSLGTIFVVGYNALASVMQGMGDGKTPLKFVAASSIINLSLDVIFVYFLDMGAGGAALATVIAQAIAMFSFVFYLKKKNFIFDFKPKSFVFVKKHLTDILKAGLPGGIKMIAINGSFLILNTFINEYGVDASAATGMINQFNGFAILIQVAISAAGSSMVSQNVGAKNIDRARYTMYYTMGLCLFLSIMVFAFVRIWPELVFKMFGADDAVIEQGLIYLQAFAFEYFCLPFIIGLSTIFLGTGNGWIPLVVDTLSSFVIRIPVAYIFSKSLGAGLLGVACSVPIASAFAVYLSLIFYLSGVWKKAFR